MLYNVSIFGATTYDLQLKTSDALLFKAGKNWPAQDHQ